MKKIAKITAAVALAAACATTAGVIAGCSSGKSGEAYGLTHGAGYVGYAKIDYKGDKVSDLTLTEVCLPTQVKATESVAEADRVAVVGTSTTYYYKNVSYGNVTLTYDATEGYKVGSETFVKYLENEDNCAIYYEAVMNNKIIVTVGGQAKTDIMTKSTLSKEENGYWTREDKDGKEYSRWKMNRDATVKYVKDNGTSKLKSLVKSETEVDDLKEDKKVKPWTDGTVTTGATWSDLNASDKKGNTYYTYAELILKADEAAKK